MTFYAEEMSFSGEWIPVMYPERPVEKNGCVLRGGAPCKRIRNIQEIPAGLKGFGLSELQEKFSKEGKEFT